VPQQKFRVAQISGAIIRDAVVQQHPVAIGPRRKDFPAFQHRAIRGAHLEILFRGSGARQHFGRLLVTFRI
jgi:hypothetical protein